MAHAVKRVQNLEENVEDTGEVLKAYMARVTNDRDKEAFSKLFDHFAPRLRSYSLAQQPGATLVADDLAQEVMIKVWNKSHLYNPDKAALSTWIFTMARNHRIDQLRRNSRIVSDIDPMDIWHEVEDEDSDPFQRVQSNRAGERVKEGLKHLPNEQVQVLAKVYLEGKSHQETADELTLPLGTVKSRVRLALQKLEVILKR